MNTSHLQHLQQIADYIILKNEYPNLGLLDGNAGISIFLYHLSRKNNDNNLERFAHSLFENIYEKQNSVRLNAFGSGFAGIGWCVEHFVKNKFYRGNTDMILEDFDIRIFKTLNEQLPVLLRLNDGLIGYLLYISSRLEEKKDCGSNTVAINKGLLRLIINRIDRRAPGELQTIAKYIQFDLLWTPAILLIVLKKVLDLNIYNNKIINMVNQLLFSLKANIPCMHSLRLYLALSLNSINENIKSSEIEKQIKILLFSIDFDELKSEVKLDSHSLQYGWFGIVLLLQKAIEKFNDQYPNYEQMEIVRQEIVRVCLPRFEKVMMDSLHTSKKEEMPQLGLATGLSGIGMLYLLYPQSLYV